jgi:hypothetical protein
MMHTHIPSPSLTVGHSSKGFGLAPLGKDKNRLDTITEQELMWNVNKGSKLNILIFIHTMKRLI